MSKARATTGKPFVFNGPDRSALPDRGRIRRWRTTRDRTNVSKGCFVATNVVAARRREQVQKNAAGLPPRLKKAACAAFDRGEEGSPVKANRLVLQAGLQEVVPERRKLFLYPHQPIHDQLRAMEVAERSVPVGFIHARLTNAGVNA